MKKREKLIELIGSFSQVVKQAALGQPLPDHERKIKKKKEKKGRK